MSYVDATPEMDVLCIPWLGPFCSIPTVGSLQSETGQSREIDPGIGKGYYWHFPIDGLMAVSVVDAEFSVKTVASFQVPDLFCLGKYNRHAARCLPEQKGPRRKKSGEALLGYACPRNTFTEVIEPGKPLRAASITLLPEAVKWLGSYLAVDPASLASAITRLDGRQNIPGLNELFELLFTVRPGAQTAQVFYESKVSEAAALLMDWWYQGQADVPVEILPVDRTSLDATIDYIKDNLGEPLNLERLCRVACMSTSKLTGIFKQGTGRTPMEYVRELRMEQACELMATSDASLGEIAEKLGFTHQGSFSEAFKARHGVTPLSYRKSHFQGSQARQNNAGPSLSA